METVTPANTIDAVRPEPMPSLLTRAVLVFTRPSEAWTGLEQRAQWWFPMLVVAVVAMASAGLLHQRALIPMMTEAWERQVTSGQLQPQQLESMERFFNSPAGLAVSVGQQAVVLPIMTLLVALVVWFGVGFVLGTGMKFRLALEVASWSSLITLPAYLLTAVMAWMKQTMRGLHVGFGILLPDVDPPTKLMAALGVILDSIGPLSIWYVVVGVLGASALSGAPRKSVAWVLGSLYLVLVVFMAALAALFTPAA
jgi:hypothetical protein